MALDLNCPLTGEAAGAAGQNAHSFLSCGAPNLTLEAVKRAEDGRGLIVRLVERHNRLTRAVLRFGRPVREAWSCDLMEENGIALRPDGRELAVTVKPYEIVTLRVGF